ncbi:hypothetical protein [Planctomicrobium piriforme]|uniref:Response regulatory domain-containing protein n=1 Tax=Planctomicrobium piriforme TaxID=1576369 RepID=A0A1I3J574_9PLAN|nr:hypothetical protein [Planctomicrobium piriforme]SFI55474.1 hypothetical protein SAMN05421753_11065 [Planctomicrobium piriforme]
MHRLHDYDSRMGNLLVHEPTSHWTAEIERTWAKRPDVSIRWRPYRESVLEELPGADLVLLVVAPDDAALDFLRQLHRLAPQAILICLVSEEIQEWELLARELGATAILPDTAMNQQVIELLEVQLRSTSKEIRHG